MSLEPFKPKYDFRSFPLKDNTISEAVRINRIDNFLRDKIIIKFKNYSGDFCDLSFFEVESVKS